MDDSQHAFEIGKIQATELLEGADEASLREWMPHHLRMLKENLENARAKGDEWEARNLEGWIKVLKRH